MLSGWSQACGTCSIRNVAVLSSQLTGVPLTATWPWLDLLDPNSHYMYSRWWRNVVYYPLKYSQWWVAASPVIHRTVKFVHSWNIRSIQTKCSHTQFIQITTVTWFYPCGSQLECIAPNDMLFQSKASFCHPVPYVSSSFCFVILSLLHLFLLLLGVPLACHVRTVPSNQCWTQKVS